MCQIRKAKFVEEIEPGQEVVMMPLSNARFANGQNWNDFPPEYAIDGLKISEHPYGNLAHTRYSSCAKMN